MRSFALSAPASARRYLVLAFLGSLTAVLSGPAQAETASPLQLAADDTGGLSGSLVGGDGQALPGAKIQLLNRFGKVIAQTLSDANGHYAFAGVLPGDYRLTALPSGSVPINAEVVVSAGTIHDTQLQAPAAAEIETITITAQRFEQARNSLSPSTGSSQFVFDESAIDKLPEGDNTPFNRILLQAPGVANDSYGQLHVRGDHADLQYRINGIILPEGVSGFGQVLDPRFAKSITLNTGALPAQYGLRTAGVVDIVTKDRIDGGSVDLYGGSHSTFNPSVEVGQTSGVFSSYLTAQYLSSNLGVEKPTPDRNAIHDHTQQGKGFGYVSYLLDENTKLSAIVASTATRLQIPNNPGQPPDPGFVTQLDNAGYDTSGLDSAKLNERQFERNLYGVLALQGILSDAANYQLAVYDRESSVTFEPDPLGDLAFNGVAADVLRKSATLGVQGDLSYTLNTAHLLSVGFSASSENDRADNTSQVFTTDNNGDVNGGPVTITDNNPKNGNTLASIYVQDRWEPVESLVVNYGLRYDRVDAFVTGGQLSPRIGVIDYLTPRTTFHAGYARYFTPPPNELVASTSIAKFANTTNAPEVTTNSSVQPERSHYFDVGVVQQLSSSLNVGLDAYYRLVRNLLDEGQFGQALIFTPFNYAKGHIYGVELTSAYHEGNLSAYGNLAWSVAQATQVASGEFNFGQDELDYISNHYVHLDHDQTLTASAGASYRWLGTSFGLDGIYGSGLRKDFANTGRLRPNLQLDFSASRDVQVSDSFGDIGLRAAVLNVLDRTNIIHDGSGIGVGAPQFGTRAAIYFGVSKSWGNS